MKNVSVIGPVYRPQNEHHLVVSGKQVPYVTARDYGDNQWSLVVDGRMEFMGFTEETIALIAEPIAQAMAFAAGYPCFGHPEKYNPFMVEVFEITNASDEPADSPQNPFSEWLDDDEGAGNEI